MSQFDQKSNFSKITGIFPGSIWAWSFEHYPPSGKTISGRNSIKNDLKSKYNTGTNLYKDLHRFGLLKCSCSALGSQQACCRRAYHLQQPKITFWSDSLYALQALSNKIHNNKSINDCHKALTKLADENTVQLKWTQAHTGHWGNIKADGLAKARTVSSNLVCSLVPLNHIKNMIKDKVNSLTHKRWNSNRHAHTDLILGNHHTKTLKILTINLNNRTRYRTGICIITGHIGLNKHLHRINRSDTSNCPNCTDTEETVAHYIGQCPAYSLIRSDT